MKTVIELVNKKYDKTLLDDKDYKKTFLKMCALLKEYDIAANAKTDAECFRIEMLYHALCNKRQFEDVFFDTYVTMFDYWYDLTYLERKQQMNIEIAKLKTTLPHFMSNDKEIYLPCFDERFNSLYTNEIVLLDLKQYHTFIRSCANEIKEHLYGYESYAHGFSSCEICAWDSLQDYVLYHTITRRFYVYRQDVCTMMFSLDPKQKECPLAVRYGIAKALLREDEEELLSLLIEYPLVGERFKKKLRKYQQKWIKKKAKEQNS